MDAAEFLERADSANREPASWERDRLTEADWLRIEFDRPLRVLRDPWPKEREEGR